MNGIEKVAISEAFYFYKNNLNKSLEKTKLKKERWNKKSQDIFEKFGKNSLYFQLITTVEDFNIQEEVIKAKIRVLNEKLKQLN